MHMLHDESSETGQLYKKFLQGAVGSDDSTPIFIVGLPRSGSTLVAQMLASHPDVWSAGEDTTFAPVALPKFTDALQTILTHDMEHTMAQVLHSNLHSGLTQPHMLHQPLHAFSCQR